jgi:peroxin-5
MRTQRQQGPGFGQNDMVNEFFGQEQQQQPAQRMGMQNNFEFSALQRELDAVRQVPHGAGGGWASEFGHSHQQQGPKLWELTPAEEAAMEKAFIESKAAAGPSQSASGNSYK